MSQRCCVEEMFAFGNLALRNEQFVWLDTVKIKVILLRISLKPISLKS